MELRIQSSSSVAGGSLFGLVLSPGITFNPDDQQDTMVLNLAGGAGYFITPQFAVGADLALTLLKTDETLTFFTIAPYGKFVTGMEEHQIGFFAEPSIGFTIADFGPADTQTLLQLTAWLGGHFFVGESAAFLVGPFFTYLRNLDSDSDDFLIGVRFGLSVYLP